VYLPHLITLALLVAGAAGSLRSQVAGMEAARAPVHPRKNVEEFAPVEAKLVRFTIARTNRGEPCLDEWEIYGPEDPGRNLALADAGARVAASGTLPEYRIHALRHVNDGIYGNAHSWICDKATGWVELELPAPIRINRMVWSRDRLGKFSDRLATEYRIEVAREPGAWQVVASSADRRAVETPGFVANHPFMESAFSTAAEPPVATGPAAREYLLETWRNAQGLPGNRVTAIAQTPDRWLWIGTVNGLARFDGVRFRPFSESEGLPGMHITCLYVDRRGVLWVATGSGGLASWEGGRFRPQPASSLPPGQSVVSLGEDRVGLLWVGTTDGLYAMEGGRLQRKAIGPVLSLAPDDTGGGIWFIQNTQLKRWMNGNAELPSGSEEPSRFGSLRTMAGGSDGTFWFGGANEYLGRFANGEVTTFAEGNAIFTTVLEEILPARNGDVWLGAAGSGLARMRDGGVLSFGAEDGMPSNHIAALCEDHEGNVWVGGNDGLTRISPRRCTALTMNDGLSHSVVTSVVEDAAGTVWVGTNGGGLNRWKGGRVVPFSPSYVLDNEVIAALVASADGTLSAGTGHSGMARLDDRKVTFFTTAQGLAQNAVSTICEDGGGGIWIGTPSGGVGYFVNGENLAPPALAALSTERITVIVSDGKGGTWFGTAGQGLVKLEGGALRRWTLTDGLAGNAVRALHLDSSGTLWIGTAAGVARLRGDTLATFSTRHGLPDPAVSQILDDASGNLWLGTNRGIVRVTGASIEAVASGKATKLEVLILDKSDGLPALECTGGFPGSSRRLRDGRLCFGTVGGLAILDPARFATPPAAPSVIIEAVSFGGDAARRPTQGEVPSVRRGNTKIQFTALAYTAPQRVHFRHRLDGLQTEWVEGGPERTATYEFLPPGNYQFIVHASVDGSPWSEASFAFRVPAPWWRTLPALAGGGVLGVVVVAGVARFITRRRLQRRLRDVEQKLAVERERTRIARDIHDQLGANLTHIGLLSASADEVPDSSARERLRAIAATSNELVQSVDAIVWAVNPRHSTLESLARYLSRFAADFLAPAGLRVRLDVPFDLPEVDLSPELRHNLYLACREVLNNVVRHAQASEVQLRMKVDGRMLTIGLADDGRGFLPDGADDGEGLENLRRRLAESGGTCEIISRPGQGTTVTFTIPLKHA
jgi:signal transduction histidine kinase/ligand-binding sensor domain-containing protein